MRALAALAAVIAAAAGLFAAARQLLNRPKRVGEAVIADPEDHTRVDAEGGVHSIQAADLTLPVEAVDEIWIPTTSSASRGRTGGSSRARRSGSCA